MAVNINGDTGIDKVQPGTIDSADFGPGSVTAPAIAANAVGTSAIADSAVTAPKVAGANGSPGQLLTSGGDGSMSWTTVASGATTKVEYITSPGTWTKPANCNAVIVTVVGGGGASSPGTGIGGNPVNGGSSSFGGYASATGGTSQPKNANTAAAAGNGTVSSGTTLALGATPTVGSVTSADPENFTYNTQMQWIRTYMGVGRTAGQPSSYVSSNTKPAAVQSKVLPGAASIYGGVGGLATVYTPVTGPVPVTIGVGGSSNYDPANQRHGKSGIVIVEWVE